MTNLINIIEKRESPGGFVFDLEQRLICANRKAMEIISGCGKKTDNGGGNVRTLPDEIYRLLDRMSCGTTCKDPLCGGGAEYLVMKNRDGIPYSLCAFFLGDLDDKLNSTHVMVLMEKIIEKHLTDVEIIGNNFSLSKREREVLRFICQGLSNKEIAEKMFICEYTVKDHIKKIMRKMCADSRGEIVFISRE